jgi:hypothetical protein
VQLDAHRQAGPWADESGALIVFDVHDEAALDPLPAADPYFAAPSRASGYRHAGQVQPGGRVRRRPHGKPVDLSGVAPTGNTSGFSEDGCNQGTVSACSTRARLGVAAAMLVAVPALAGPALAATPTELLPPIVSSNGTTFTVGKGAIFTFCSPEGSLEAASFVSELHSEPPVRVNANDGHASAGPSAMSRAAGLSRLGDQSRYRMRRLTLCACSWQAGAGSSGGVWCRSWWPAATR